MKKKLILVFLVIFLYVIGFLVYKLYLNNISILSGDARNVEKITVIKDMYSSSDMRILSNTESEPLLNALKAVRTMMIKHPKHLESMTCDSKYVIEIAYTDGKVDKIYSTEIGVKFFRFIKTKGPDGDSGYILTNKDESIHNMLKKYVP